MLDFVIQPPGLPQYSPREALRKGTLWPALYSPYKKHHTARHTMHDLLSEELVSRGVETEWK